MEENKVTISLNEYLKLYDGQKERDKEFQTLLAMVFENTELTGDKKNLKFDYYNSKMMSYLKQNYPEKYQKQVNFLNNEED
jgi:hypothetical protein|nr:MAG TPA: hypothetical protein [Caudoviricetes sp.]